MKLNYNFIKIDNNKVPLNKLDITFKYDDVKNDKATAILIEEPFIVPLNFY